MAANIDAEEVVAELEARLDRILKAEFGDSVSWGTGRYTDKDLSVRITFPLAIVNIARTMDLRRLFERVAPRFGLLASDFDLPLFSRGNPAVLTRLDLSRPKYPFILRDIDSGILFKVAAEFFIAARAKATRTENPEDPAACLHRAEGA